MNISLPPHDSLQKLIISVIVGLPTIVYAWVWAWRIARGKGGSASLSRLILRSHLVGLALTITALLGWVAFWVALARGLPEFPAAGTGMVNHPYDYGIFGILYLFLSALAGSVVACRMSSKRADTRNPDQRIG